MWTRVHSYRTVAIQDPRRPGFISRVYGWWQGNRSRANRPSGAPRCRGRPVDVADGGPADGGPELFGIRTAGAWEPGWFRHEFGMGHIPRIGN